MEMTIVSTPFIALDYLTKGDSSNLSPEQIQIADDWAKDWEILSVEEISEDEPTGHTRLEPCMVAEDREYDDDFREIA